MACLCVRRPDGCASPETRPHAGWPSLRWCSRSTRSGWPAADCWTHSRSGWNLWLKADAQRGKRDRRSIGSYYEAIRALGYTGGKTQVYNHCRRWHQEETNTPRNAGFVPLSFELGEAFQFDWSCEYAFVGGLRRRLEVAHIKLAASRAFLLVAYYSQAHEMLFDAHTRGFQVLGGVPKRGIYDNMRTAVDKVGAGKQRSVNARFETMTGHYLFEAEFCNRAAGWEKGIVEKNVQDRRRGIWREAGERRWTSLVELNAWLGEGVPERLDRDGPSGMARTHRGRCLAGRAGAADAVS